MKDQKNHKGLIAVLVIIILILLALVVLLATDTISLKPKKDADANPKEVANSTVNTKPTKPENKEEPEEEPTSTKTQEETTTTEPTKEEVPSSTNKSSVETSKILEYYKEKVGSATADSSNNEHQYAIADINNDKIPELFIYTGGFAGNTIIGEISVFTYDEKTGSASSHNIVSVGTIQGRLSINTILYKMNDGTLLSVYAHSGYQETSTYKLENNGLTRINHETKETNTYDKGDKEIAFVDVSDTSLFENYK